MEDEKFLIMGEGVLPSVTGEGADGEPFLLGSDIFIYSRCVAVEQGVFDRLRTGDQTLADELGDTEKYKAQILMGDAEEIRKYLKGQVDGMIDAIIEYRKNKKNEK